MGGMGGGDPFGMGGPTLFDLLNGGMGGAGPRMRNRQQQRRAQRR